MGFALYEAVTYLLYSPGVVLLSAEQIEIRGNRFVTPDAIAEKFSADLGRSVVRIPLTERREALESLPWVDQAHVQRVLPNRIRVEITERTPVAFLRTGSDLSLVDAQGVILDRPVEGEFRFPVVGGIGEFTPRATREQHMNMYVQFMKEIDSCPLWGFRFWQPVSFACGKYRPVASQRRERRFGGFAVRAASSSESGIEDHRGHGQAERAPERTHARAPARESRAEAALTELENLLPGCAHSPGRRIVGM
jgi:hypothetical protein